MEITEDNDTNNQETEKTYFDIIGFCEKNICAILILNFIGLQNFFSKLSINFQGHII